VLQDINTTNCLSTALAPFILSARCLTLISRCQTPPNAGIQQDEFNISLMTIHQIIAYKTLLNGINYFNESVHRDLERTKNYNIHTNSQIDKENDLTK